MKTRFLFSLALMMLALPAISYAREVVLPAGTLLNCSLDEPNFSSATVSVGDPFLCHPRNIQMFGQSVFPRGAYLVGHLESDKEPGHFWGKGNLKLQLDRIGLAGTDLPLTAKVIAVKGYKVDREGKIIGKGHATRDTVEWMLPPLWPWKVLMLPARGPRPTLKGETRITMRLMEDVTVPLPDGPARGPFGDPRGALSSPSFPKPSALENTQRLSPEPARPAALITAEPAATATLTTVAETAPAVRELAISATAPEPALTSVPREDRGWRTFATARAPSSVTLFAMKEGTVLAVTSYRRDQNVLSYVLTSGITGTLDLREVDWTTTTDLNRERGFA
ncbi:MAG TPA: hypothetical protein VFL42_14390 [Terriglobales bacterium]|nr:hypothetical protein [Terriglobales bacterium]